MSFYFLESLMDKFLFPHKNSDSSINGKFTGSQSLMESTHRMNYNIFSEFQELLESNLSVNTPSINRLPAGIINLLSLKSSYYSSVNQIPKLFLPSFSNHFQDSFSGAPNKTRKSESYLNCNNSLVNEMYPISIFKARNLNCENLFSTEMPSSPKNFTTASTICNISKSNLQERRPSPPKVAEKVMSPKQVVDNNKVLNQELSNRKAKELQKRSKKRRRRQKRSGLNDKEKSNSSKNKNMALKTENKVIQLLPNPCTLSDSASGNEDTFCDITENVGQTSSVQILFPEISSFFISVESGNEDEVDWDSSSDSEWLSNCAEFEFSGLFVTNLTASRSIACLSDELVSQLNVPCNYFNNAEVQNLNSKLLEVNRTWNESIRELEKKPKLVPKVTFAPDDRLVKVVPVESYERKGEWETYALERCHFKRRINELEKILSPCLSKSHREKVYLNLQQLEL